MLTAFSQFIIWGTNIYSELKGKVAVANAGDVCIYLNNNHAFRKIFGNFTAL